MSDNPPHEELNKRYLKWAMERALYDECEDERSEELQEIENQVEDIWANIGDFGARAEAASLMIERLMPGYIDIQHWQDIALGKNFRLRASQQYGPIGDRVKARNSKVQNPPKGNYYGKVHDKGKQSPSEFIKRQGKALTNAAMRVQNLERDLELAKEYQAEIQAGLRTYATTCLLTAMRDAVSPMFAMGPAWTLLRAISGKTGEEVAIADAELQTKRILVALHALREHPEFERELKSAIHAICIRYEGEVKRRGAPCNEFDGLYHYEEIIKSLEWPPYPD